jgi:hypothetical protein
LQEADQFPHLISNHDGKDSEKCEAFCVPLGDARSPLNVFVALIEGITIEGVESRDDERLL